jgi:hypothetical protein
LLANRQRRQEDRYQPGLAERKAELGMAGDLEDEATVAPLEKKLVAWRSPEWQSTEYERPGVEAEVLSTFIPPSSDERNPLGLP